MIENIVSDLIDKEENEWLEFKSYWYWKDGDRSSNRGWGEFLKDLSALINTASSDNEKKYLVCGFDEHTKKCQDYNVDIDGNQIKFFSKKSDVKSKIHSKLRRHFKSVPEYGNSSDLVNIESAIDLHVVLLNGCKLFVIEIYPAPYLLELKVLLQGNESFREGNIITRNLKSDNSPENRNATTDEILALKEKIEDNKNELYPEKDITIMKIVDAFKSNFFPSGELSEVSCNKNYSDGKYFEIYHLQGEYMTSIDFIYYSKYTSQKATLEYIVKNDFSKGDKKIILVDRYNKKGGQIDKKRIESLFSNNWKDVEVYYLEEFAVNKIYQDRFNHDIFHQGNFNIKNFIQPFTNISKSKNAHILLNEWYRNNNSPLLVIKGTGGIGKTTVLKNFLDLMYRETESTDNVHILFISSHEIINEIMRHDVIEDIFDFYNVVAEKNDVIEKFDKKLLELSIDNGNLIVAIDGLDEVIAKMGSKFNVTHFIEAIYSNYSHNLEKTKIVITCRDYFWDKHAVNRDIDSITLLPFSEELAVKYFSFSFQGNKIERALDLANQFAVSREDQNIYVPYILDMISENLLDGINTEDVTSEYLLPKDMANDYLVAKVCEREIVKLENLDIDTQLDVFMEIANRYEGVLVYDHFSSLKEKFDRVINNSVIEKFKGHPLLRHDSDSRTIRFRYDFFNEYFKTIALSKFLKNDEFEEITEEIIEILINHIGYDNSFTKAVTKRIKDVSFDELLFSGLNCLQNVFNSLDISLEKKRHLNSSIFLLLLAKDQENTVEKRTNIIKDLYSMLDGKIEGLEIINLHTKSKINPIFDFRNLQFEGCHFENYEYFCECKYDDKTFFSNCKFIGPLSRDKAKVKMSLENFDFNSCDDRAGLENLLRKAEDKGKAKEDGLRTELKTVIRFFWANGAFKLKMASEARRKLRTSTNTLDFLVKNKIILKRKKHTKQKKNDLFYLVNPDFSNLRKIFEENRTCSEFEKIVHLYNQ